MTFVRQYRVSLPLCVDLLRLLYRSVLYIYIHKEELIKNFFYTVFVENP